MKKIKNYTLLFILTVACSNCKSQTLRLLSLYNNKYNSAKNSTDFITLGIRKSIVDSFYFTLSTYKNEKLLFKGKANSSILEVFENRYLIISKRSYSKFLNGEPDFVDNREDMYIVDLFNLNSRYIFQVHLGGKKILSNAIELTKINKSFNYDFGIKKISLKEKNIEFMNIETGEKIKYHLLEHSVGHIIN